MVRVVIHSRTNNFYFHVVGAFPYSIENGFASQLIKGLLEKNGTSTRTHSREKNVHGEQFRQHGSDTLPWNV